MKAHALRTGAVAAWGGVVFALVPGTPAVAYAPTGAPDGSVTPAGVLVTRWSRVEFYVNRPTVQHLAAISRKWDKSMDASNGLAATLACLRAGSPAAIGLCSAAVALAGSYPLDRLQEADRLRGCLRIAITFGVPEVSAYNDTGAYCRGRRG